MTRPNPSPSALSDVDKATDHYLTEAGPQVATAFKAAFQAALTTIRSQPHAGSPRLAGAMQEPDLRIWPVRGFPYLIFYLDRPDGVLIWRVLHTARDIPSSLRG